MVSDVGGGAEQQPQGELSQAPSGTRSRGHALALLAGRGLPTLRVGTSRLTKTEAGVPMGQVLLRDFNRKVTVLMCTKEQSGKHRCSTHLGVPHSLSAWKHQCLLLAKE